VTLVLGAPVLAQTSLSFGPEVAPVGCPVVRTLSNDNTFDLMWDPTLIVTDVNGAPVVTIPGGPVVVGPGQSSTSTWMQQNSAGNQVAPGSYFVNGTPVTVGGADTGIVRLGGAKTGTARPIMLCSPLDAGRPYRLLASTSSTTGIPTCAGVIPLDRSRLLALSRSARGIFQDFAGTFDAQGLSTGPVFAIPPDAGLAGLNVTLAFLVLDPAGPCPVRRISAPLEFTIF
jgi:hypothetical protein